MNSLLHRRIRLSTTVSIALAVSGASFALAQWHGELGNLEALRYAGAATAFLGARLLAGCPICQYPPA